jgi:hypothetical protein
LLWLKRASRSIPQLLNPGAIDHAHYPVTCPNRTQSGQVVKIKPSYRYYSSGHGAELNTIAPKRKERQNMAQKQMQLEDCITTPPVNLL